MNATPTALSLRNVTKRFGSFVAVDDISLDIAPGEFVSFLGPSGSGKTTTLQMIAGFASPDAGRILLGERDLTRIPTHKRDIGVVFQNYALFPHLTVAQNIAFSLKMRRVRSAEIARRVSDAIEMVHLGKFADRKPAALSGGQQQRVALARAFVFNPRLLLMDEPLGALDKKLRELLQVEITRIARDLGVTVVYVTHDQEEALAMSDRIAIYNEGHIEQIGRGPDLYERPTSLFVATFMGDSNIITGDLRLSAGAHAVETPVGSFAAVAPSADLLGQEGTTVKLVVRPEHIRIDDMRDGERGVAATVRQTVYLGTSVRVIVDAPGIGELTVLQSADGRAVPRVGDRVTLSWAQRDGIVLADTKPATLTGLITTQ